MCVALRDFHSRSLEEVDAREDDLLEIMTSLDEDWLIVRHCFTLGQEYDDEKRRQGEQLS